jgi:hypothetical protein
MSWNCAPRPTSRRLDLRALVRTACAIIAAVRCVRCHVRIRSSRRCDTPGVARPTTRSAGAWRRRPRRTPGRSRSHPTTRARTDVGVSVHPRTPARRSATRHCAGRTRLAPASAIGAAAVQPRCRAVCRWPLRCCQSRVAGRNYRAILIPVRPLFAWRRKRARGRKDGAWCSTIRTCMKPGAAVPTPVVLILDLWNPALTLLEPKALTAGITALGALNPQHGATIR